MIIIGWDVSTAAIGICIKTKENRSVYHVLFPIGKTHLQKHRNALVQIKNFMASVVHQGHPEIAHFVEDRLDGFTGGLTTKHTLMVLAAMNAVVSCALSDYGSVTHIGPNTAKRIMGLKVDKDAGETKKEAVIKLARSADPHFPYRATKAGKFAKGVDDMADAWLLAEAGSKVLSGEASIGPAKKAVGGKGKARRTKNLSGKKV